MRKIIFILVLHFLLWHNLAAQADVVEQVSVALHSGNSSKVVQYMDNVVEMTLNNKHSSFSKAQADMVLKQFFEKNTPKEYDLEYVGYSQNKSTTYGIGEMKTTNGITYKVYMMFKKKGKTETYILQEIRFEKI